MRVAADMAMERTRRAVLVEDGEADVLGVQCASFPVRRALRVRRGLGAGRSPSCRVRRLGRQGNEAHGRSNRES